jgi:uncharacterized protein YkwD
MKDVLLPLVALGLLGSACLTVKVSARDKAGAPVKMSTEEKELFDLINKERLKADLKPLRPNTVLFKVARAHSANMARQHELNHVLDKKTPFMRMKEAGYRYYRGGENIAYGDRDITLPMLVKGWMDSKHHRENILNPAYQETGLGIATDDKGVVYYTQTFGKPLR